MNILNWISAICSVSGISLLTVFRYAVPKAKNMKYNQLKHYIKGGTIAAIGIFAISILFKWSPWVESPVKKIQPKSLNVDIPKSIQPLIIKHDTVYKIVMEKPKKQVKRTTLTLRKQGTSKNTAKFNLQNPTFNAPTQVGDNNTQNNTVAELPDRVLNDTDKDIIRSLIKPGYTIDMRVIKSGSEETQNYGMQLFDYLKHTYTVSNFTMIGQSSENRKTGRMRFYHTINDNLKIIYILVQTQQ
jgi:hypothetical protein